MAGSLGKRGKAGIWSLACLSLGLLLSGLPARAAGTRTAPQPRHAVVLPRRRPGTAVTAPASASGPPPGEPVHFTAQGDIGVGSGAKKVLDVVAGLNPT